MTDKITIACLGWGSLVWNSGKLEIPIRDWKHDGPNLPIEFSRISDNGRVTLIIDEAAEPQTVLWTKMHPNNLDEAIQLLSEREGTVSKNIHSLRADETPDNGIKLIIAKWLKSKPEIDAVIWTGLSFGRSTNRQRPSLEYIVEYLEGLTDPETISKVKEYIIKAPAQIDTVYRREIEEKLGWAPLG